MSNERILSKSPEVIEGLLEATGRLMQQFGYRKTSVEDIAQAAGVSRATAYLYFPNKEALVTGWLQARADQRLEVLRELARSEPEPVERLRRLLLGRLELSLDRARNWGEHLDELLAALRGPLQRWREHMLGQEAALLAETLSDPAFTLATSPQECAVVLCLAIHGLLAAHLGSADLTRPERVQERSRQLVDLLLRGVTR